jgi:hypothetical protein
MIDLRARLDEALHSLTLCEIREQLGIAIGMLGFPEDEPIPGQTKANLHILFRSEAFLRYVNAYHFFAIRFWAHRELSASARQPVTYADSNARPFALMPPPDLTDIRDAMQRFAEFAIISARQPNTAIDTALSFLDDFHPRQNGPVQYEMQEPSHFELWLRGLDPDSGAGRHPRFEEISKGLVEWANARSNFYLSLKPEKPALVERSDGQDQFERPPEGWLVKHPMAARFALADVYWIARLLRADVSENATVTYQKYNWLHLLRFKLLLDDPDDKQKGAKRLNKAEEALRSVFDFVCDLIQNSVEIRREKDRIEADDGNAVKLPDATARWRAAFNEELEEITEQRKVRRFQDPSLPKADGAGPVVPPPPGKQDENWSTRVRTGECPANLIGVAFSGGGIRSATFNLGVLQGLQELDLLRHIDYLSTVSGGGFIGSWLVANVRRSAHWLGRLTDWSDSIAHLRSHSNYLAPRTGVLSVDTWNIGNSWFRNAFLIQLTGLAWLFALLLATVLGLRLFLEGGQAQLHSFPVAGYVAALAAVMLVFTIPYYVKGASSGRGAKKSGRTPLVVWLVVVPAWIGAWSFASQFWAAAPMDSGVWLCLRGMDQYSALFKDAWSPWMGILIAALAGFSIIAFFTLRDHWGHALWIGPICTFVLYLELVGIFLLFRMWSGLEDTGHGLGFVFGPALVLVGFTVCVLLLIGFTGRNTGEARREWWTRFGTWLGIFAGLGVFLCGIAVFGPWLVLQFLSWTNDNHQTLVSGIKWTSVLSWLGTVVGGLFAGKSSKTAGEGESSPSLETLAKVGGFLFIIGSFVAGSTLLYLLMFEIFAPDNSVLTSSVQVMCELCLWQVIVAFVAALVIGLLFSWWFEINIFGLNQFYRNRLVLCYLGATRWTPGARKPNAFTKFDFKDDLALSRFRTKSSGAKAPDSENVLPERSPYRGPLPLINCALNLGGSPDLALNTRHSDSFTLTPLRCGSDRPKVGYAPTDSADGKFADGVPLGQAVSISGAAVSSNMGYNTSPLVAFLLTMFNVRLGWWFPNPGQNRWKSRGLNFSLYYLLRELLGIADENRNFLNVSDGGHFENLAVYELIRRRCKLIIACDAECDEQMQFGGLGNLVRICGTDFGAEIDIDVKSIRPTKEGHSLAHCSVGIIKYSSGEIGRLIYLKASITGDEDVSIAQYRSSHPSFPHESTADQFYTEDQFESYRKLGLHVVRASFKGNLPGDDPLMIAERMVDVLTPAGCPSDAFIKHSDALKEIWEKFRASTALLSFMNELMTLTNKTAAADVTDDELCIGLEMIQLMEDVFLDLRLDDFWEHPDNRGWAILFMRWARSPRFRIIWGRTRRTFGIRFEYFCNARLGLKRDRPIVRV